MKNKLFVIVLVSLLFSCIENSSKKEISSENEILESQHFNRGLSFGKAYKDKIQKQIEVWGQIVQEEIHFNQTELYEYINVNTGLIEACEEYAPELLLELQGIAEGADVNYEVLMNLNLAEEIMLFFGQGYQSCTNIGFKTKEANYLAYNLDLPEFLRVNEPYVVKENGKIYYGFPGILATGGINKNFAVTTNSLPNNTMNKDGLPLPFMLRKLLDAKSIKDAKQILETIPLGAPQNFMLVSRTDMIDLERSKNKLEDASQEGVMIYHTNFPVKNNDTIVKEKEICQRYKYLEQVSKTEYLYKHTKKLTLIELLTNENPSTILNDETYLSFITIFPNDNDKPIEFHALSSKYNPKPLLIKL